MRTSWLTALCKKVDIYDYYPNLLHNSPPSVV